MIRNKPSLSYAPNTFEISSWSDNKYVIGLDEAGRGCLAGPVVAAAVILPPYPTFSGLKDSKKLSPVQREEAFEWIKAHCQWSVGIVDHRTIDRCNIYVSSQKAMIKALTTLLALTREPPAALLTDAMPLAITPTGLSSETPVIAAPKGEDWSSSIAAASIVAKVTRDHLMTQLARSFPHYGLAIHKGYSTKNHKNMILEHGICVIHRTTFLTDTLIDHKADHGTQQTLC